MTDSVNLLIYLDSECLVTLINNLFIQKYILNTEIQVMTILISVNQIIGNKHMINKYIMFTWYFSSQKADEIWVLFKIKRKVHIITDLYVDMLIKMNIMSLENIDLITSEKYMLIKFTDTSILIDYKVSNLLIR